jgi:hypothetical protein
MIRRICSCCCARPSAATPPPAEHGDEIAPLQLIELHLLSLAKEAA